MVNINLFPWREPASQYERKILIRFFILSVVIMITMSSVIHIFLTQREDKLSVHIQNMNEHFKQIGGVEGQLMVSPSHDFLPIIFKTLGKMQQGLACFTEIKQDEQTFLFKGKAKSVQALSEYVSQFPSNFFGEMRMEEIKQDEKGEVVFAFGVKK